MRSPLEPSQNDVWTISADIPYWWRITTQILVVLLIGRKKIPTNKKGYQDLGRDTSSVWNFCAPLSDVVLRRAKWRPGETSAVFLGYTIGRFSILWLSRGKVENIQQLTEVFSPPNIVVFQFFKVLFDLIFVGWFQRRASLDVLTLEDVV